MMMPPTDVLAEASSDECNENDKMVGATTVPMMAAVIFFILIHPSIGLPNLEAICYNV
ncbi:hypothetical protein QS257_10095 [Terrilactibacillus sp. S3-3]|nr:hypothetical protein QS257_10095 [Terrilactibacillus sp. S3-3]